MEPRGDENSAATVANLEKLLTIPPRNKSEHITSLDVNVPKGNRVLYNLKLRYEVIPEHEFLKTVKLFNKGVLIKEWRMIRFKKLLNSSNASLVFVCLSLRAAKQVEIEFNRRIRFGAQGLTELRRVTRPGEDRIIGLRRSTAGTVFGFKKPEANSTNSIVTSTTLTRNPTQDWLKYSLKMRNTEMTESYFYSILQKMNDGLMVDQWKVVNYIEIPDNKYEMIVFVILSPEAAKQLENQFYSKIRLMIGFTYLQRVFQPGEEQIIGYTL